MNAQFKDMIVYIGVLQCTADSKSITKAISAEISTMPDFDCPPDEQFSTKFAVAFHDYFKDRINDVVDANTLALFMGECLAAVDILLQNKTALADFVKCPEYTEFEKMHDELNKGGFYGRSANATYQSLWLMLISAAVMMKREPLRFKPDDGYFGANVFSIKEINAIVERRKAKEAA